MQTFDKKENTKGMFNSKKKRKSISKNNQICSHFAKLITRKNANLELKSNNLPAVKTKNDLVPISENKSKKKSMIIIILSFFAGVINGLFGGGAGMLVVPILEKIISLPTKKAHATAVLVVLPLCLFSVVAYLLTSKFDFSNGFWIVAGVVVGGVIGALLLKKLNSNVVRFLFAFLVIFAGGKLFFDTVSEII